MHPNHQSPPFFARLDDGRVVQHEHPGPAALTAASSPARDACRDPALLDLAAAALDAPVGSILTATAAGVTTLIDRPCGGVLGLMGAMCPPGAAAVAASVECRTVWPDGAARGGVLAWSANRQGDSLALFRQQPGEGVEVLSAVAGPLLDGAMRALGCSTPPCPAPVVWFPDGVFLHQLMRLFGRRRDQCDHRPPTWDDLSVLYPLNISGEPRSPRLTRGLRQEFQLRNTWSSLRRRVVDMPASAPAVFPGLMPEVAGWLDDGSFARWVLSRVSDVPSTLEWLHERVDGALSSDLSLALGEVRELAGGGNPPRG